MSELSQAQMKPSWRDGTPTIETDVSSVGIVMANLMK